MSDSSYSTVKCPKCNSDMTLESVWAPNNDDKRWYGECKNCGFETDDEFDYYHQPEKEVLIADADGSRYIHGEGYQVGFDFERWYTEISTRYSWEGKVKITIEPYLSSQPTIKKEEEK